MAVTIRSVSTASKSAPADPVSVSPNPMPATARLAIQAGGVSVRPASAIPTTSSPVPAAITARGDA